MSLPPAPASRRKQVESPRVAARQLAGVQDLVRVERRQRDLRGADQEQLVAGNLVDHLPLAGEEAGAVQRALADEHRRDHRNEPLAADQLDREAHQGQLDQHQVAEQVGEARARGLARLLHLDPAVGEAQVEVVADLELELGALADLPQDHGVVLGRPFRSLWRRKVGKLGHELVALRLDLGQLGLELLHLGAHLAHLGDQRLGVLPGALRRRDLVGGPVLPGAPLLDLGKQLTAALVEAQQLVEGLGGAAPRQRGPGRLGVLADAPKVEHQWSTWPGGCSLLGARPGARSRRLAGLGTGVLGDELRDADRLLAGDDVLGHDRAREAAISDREQDVVDALGALVEIRALRAERPVGGALRPRGRQRVTARAALREQHRAAIRGVVLRHRDPLGPARGEDQRRRDRRCDARTTRVIA